MFNPQTFGTRLEWGWLSKTLIFDHFPVDSTSHLHTLYCKRFVRLRVLFKTHNTHDLDTRGWQILAADSCRHFLLNLHIKMRFVHLIGEWANCESLQEKEPCGWWLVLPLVYRSHQNKYRVVDETLWRLNEPYIDLWSHQIFFLFWIPICTPTKFIVFIVNRSGTRFQVPLCMWAVNSKFIVARHSGNRVASE